MRLKDNMAASPSSEWEDSPCVKSCPPAYSLSCERVGQTCGFVPTLSLTLSNKKCLNLGE